ncbi:MAG: hypothetical protein Q9188_005917 [Gyalolechia gomerana]
MFADAQGKRMVAFTHDGYTIGVTQEHQFVHKMEMVYCRLFDVPETGSSLEPSPGSILLTETAFVQLQYEYGDDGQLVDGRMQTEGFPPASEENFSA